MYKQSSPEFQTPARHVNKTDRPAQIAASLSNGCVRLCECDEIPIDSLYKHASATGCTNIPTVFRTLRRCCCLPNRAHTTALYLKNTRTPDSANSTHLHHYLLLLRCETIELYMLYVFDLLRKHLSIIPPPPSTHNLPHPPSSASTNSTTSCSHNESCVHTQQKTPCSASFPWATGTHATAHVLRCVTAQAIGPVQLWKRGHHTGEVTHSMGAGGINHPQRARLCVFARSERFFGA